MKFKTLSLLFIFSSCSIFIENYEKDIFEKNNIIPKQETKEIYCKNKPSFSLISENKKSQKSFKNFLNTKKGKFTKIEQAILWSLIQINLRPDQSSPTSKLQIVYRLGEKTKYYQSYSREKTAFPYLELLSKILKEHKSKYTLLKLAKILDSEYKGRLYVSKNLELFLDGSKGQLTANNYLKKVFIRGDETLKENERLPKINFSKLIRYASRKNFDYEVSDFLFENNNYPETNVACNFDMKLYDNSLFLINSKKVSSNIFGIKSSKFSFLAVSTNNIQDFKRINNTFLLSGTSEIRSASICIFKPKLNSNGNELWLMSDESRDPGQHLFHLIQYGIESIQSFEQLSTMLSFSRHQFLKDPVRLIIESRKSSEKQLEELLKLNIPIYNSKKLGRLWGYMSLKNQSSFILDERRKGHIQCN